MFCDYFLTTDRLGFGHWNESDLEMATTLWGDSRVAEFIGGPFTAENIRARLTREIETMIASRDSILACIPVAE